MYRVNCYREPKLVDTPKRSLYQRFWLLFNPQHSQKARKAMGGHWIRYTIHFFDDSDWCQVADYYDKNPTWYVTEHEKHGEIQVLYTKKCVGTNS